MNMQERERFNRELETMHTNFETGAMNMPNFERYLIRVVFVIARILLANSDVKK